MISYFQKIRRGLLCNFENRNRAHQKLLRKKIPELSDHESVPLTTAVTVFTRVTVTKITRAEKTAAAATENCTPAALRYKSKRLKSEKLISDDTLKCPQKFSAAQR